jgi:hypothetical protein
MTTSELRDVQARTVRILEAVQDGDVEFAEQALDDLAADLWAKVEMLERAA